MSEISRRQTLTSLVPRQVMLETAAAAAAAAASSVEETYKKKRKDELVAVTEVEEEEKKSKKKKKKSSSHPSHAAEGASDALDRPSGDSLLLKWNGREDLLKSIAAFLESSGFSRTLSIFRSEAQIEVGNRGSSFNLEDLFDKFIELSKKDPVASIDCSKEQGRLIVDAANDSSVEIINKKGKRKGISDSQVEKDAEKSQLDASIGTAENTDDAKPQNKEKKKKQKVVLGEDKNNVKEKIKELKAFTSNSSLVTDAVENIKCEKKKEEKEANSSPEQVEFEVNQELVDKKSNDGDTNASSKHPQTAISDNSVKDLKEMVDRTKKDKKKHKNNNLEKSTSDNIHKISSGKLVEETSNGGGNHVNGGLQWLASTEKILSMSEEHTCCVEKITNKKRKGSSKEASLKVEDITAATKSEKTKSEGANDKEETWDHKVLANCELPPFEKKRKTVKSKGESNKPSEALSFDVLDKDEENPTLMEPQKELSGHHLANGSIEKLPKEESTEPKSLKKQKHSGEPKTINAFQRVKIDEVRFADERLQDNSYWALDDSGSGYGAKAQEVLGQVRGRDFRHEKTKKKRGTYRGGQIDLQSHSVKFNYSDDE